MSSGDLRRRLVWLVAARLVLSTTLFGWAVLAQVRTPTVDNSWFYLLIALAYASSLVFGLTSGIAARHRWLVDLQIAGDAALVTLFIACTGGVNSYFSSLYFLPILAAGTLQLRRGALTVALLTGLLYGGLVLCQYQELGFLPPWLRYSAALPASRVAFYSVAINLFAYFAVGYLAGALAEGVRTAGARLERASTEIRDLQAFNEHVINSLASGLVTSDTQGRVLTFNRAAEHITGRLARETIGHNAEDVLQLPGGFVAALDAELERGANRRLDYVFRTADGKAMEMGLSASALVTPDGRAGFLFNFQDVTNVRKLEREARLQHRLAAVGEMAAGIAHEIRNPLASISGSIQILRQDLEVNEEQGQLMDIVTRESERLNGIIRNFLDYARPKRFAIAPLDLAAVIRDAAVLLRNHAEVGEGHRIETDLPAHPVPYDADEGQIRQIIWNLATNGLRAMPHGGRLRLCARLDPSPSVAASDAACGVVLTVEDQGVGIPAEDLDRIFQPFHGSFEKGSGLGLAIVHRIVTDYGGEIEVTSKAGTGTRIQVRLPGRAVSAQV